MGGLDEYRQDPMLWIMETVAENWQVVGTETLQAEFSTEDLLEPCWDFITQTFEENEMSIPSRNDVLEHLQDLHTALIKSSD